KGFASHGHMAEANNHGGPDGPPLPTQLGPAVSSINIAGFTYSPGNQGSESLNGGIPTVKAGNNVTFYNEDASADIYHSITACQNPCNGATGIAYPLSNASICGDPLNFDSTTLVYGARGLRAPSNTYRYLLQPPGAGGDPP